MATSTIKLFVGCKIVPEKNFKVDSIWDYLNTILDTTIVDFMYVKNKKNITLKIDLPQTKLKVDSANNINYIAVTNSDETSRAYFYFVKERNWKSSNTIEYVCEMDTINTFAYGSDYTLTDKTTIQRQHKDRFKSEFVYANKLSGGVTDWGVRSVGGITSAKFVVNDSHLIGLAQSDIYFNCSIDYLPGQTEGTMTIDYTKLTSDGIITINITGLDALPAFNYVITYHTNAKNLTRIIDEESEGFNVPLWGKDEEVLTQEITEAKNGQFKLIDLGEHSWYLTYKTNTAYDSSHPDDFIYDNAINCYLTTDYDDLGIITAGNSIKITKADYLAALTAVPDHNSNKMYVGFPTGAKGKKVYNSFSLDYPEINSPMQLMVELKDSSNNVLKRGFISCSWWSNSNHKRMKQTCLIFSQTGSDVYVRGVKLKVDNVVKLQNGGPEPETEFSWTLGATDYIEIYGVSRVDGYFTTKPVLDWIFSCYQVFVNANAGSYAFTTAATSAFETLKSFKDVNRTDQKLVKIINVPYAPISINKSSEMIWNSTEKQLTLNIDAGTKEGVYDPKFSYTVRLIPNNESGDNYLLTDNIKLSNITPSLTDAKNINKESKLLHSDFYYISCNYDSFNYVFRNELLDVDNLPKTGLLQLNKIDVNYAVSNSMTSAFALDFGYEFPLKKQYQAYNVMCVNRNLEIPIYNNYYMNYLRNGYNYDVKNKNTQAIGTGIGVGLGVASTVAGIALSATGYGSTFGAPMIVTGVSSIAGSTANAVIKSTQADRNIQQKLDEAKNQGASVSGSDDIGLLKWYANNNLCKLMKWECSDNTKERLFDLFYYCGYICNYQAVPNMTSRAWFNFVQCEPQFGICYVPNDLKEDISNKFKAGITVLHKQNGTWDFDQAKENWENTLLN